MPRTGTVQYRPARSTDQPGKWFGRITCIDNSRPWVELGKWPNSPQGRARAKETARACTERFRTQGIVGARQRGPRAVALRETRASEASQWWASYSRHRAGLSLISIDGAYRTHIAPVIDKPWAEVTAADCERLRDALDAKARDGAIAGKTAFNVWSVWTTAAKAAAGQWKKDKSRKLRARDDNPCAGIAAPDRDGDKELQWLYPDELLELVTCEAVPSNAAASTRS